MPSKTIDMGKNLPSVNGYQTVRPACLHEPWTTRESYYSVGAVLTWAREVVRATIENDVRARDRAVANLEASLTEMDTVLNK